MKASSFLCIAHRGAMGHAPENTLAAVEKALELGAQYIEVDVQYIDGQLIVFHDDTLERTTNGTGRLCDQSFESLRLLDAGDGQQIPTLAEVCELIDARTCINIELKATGSATHVAALLSRLLSEGWHVDHFLISSFHYEELIEIKRLQPEIKRGLLLAGCTDAGLQLAQDIEAYSIHPTIDCVDAALIVSAHKQGMKVFVYTADTDDDIRHVEQIGADGVFSGYPERVPVR